MVGAVPGVCQLSAPQTVVFFDLDGTLTDPKLGITRSIQYAMKTLGFEPPEMDALTWCIGPPLAESFQRLVGRSLVERAVSLYRERFADIGWEENARYGGVLEVLATLEAAGVPLYVATSKPTVFATKIVAHFDMEPYFLRVFGAELNGVRSNKAELLAYAMNETGCGADSVMIGDRKHDVIGAKANGLMSIGVSYGYGSVEELTEAGAEAIVHQPEELFAAICGK